MHDKEFRNLFVLVLAFGAFCATLFTATVVLPDPGGFGFLFRMVACVALIVGFLIVFAVDLIGIWTGDLPHLHHDKK